MKTPPVVRDDDVPTKKKRNDPIAPIVKPQQPSYQPRLSLWLIRWSDSMTLPKLLRTTVWIRIGMVLCMAISCQLIPDFIADDTSLVYFDLRLDPLISRQTQQVQVQPPASFALSDSFCNSLEFNDASRIMNQHTIAVKNVVYRFLLTPLTRWDAARFLRLANNPEIRNPQWRLFQLQQQQMRHTDSDTTKKSCPTGINDILEQMIQESEQAHAFLPFFPKLVQIVTKQFLFRFFPPELLPPTCESMLTMAAWILNTVCFVWAAKQLYDSTLLIFEHADSLEKNIADGDVRDTEDDTAKRKRKRSEAEQWARRVVLLFILNPAGVFFTSAYSESLGAAFVFTGCRFLIEHRVHRNPLALGKAVSALWMACWTRSNGSIYAGFLLLYGIGWTLNKNQGMIRRILSLPTFVLLMSVLVIGSMGQYNNAAFHNHCNNYQLHDNDHNAIDNESCLVPTYQPPLWCKEGPLFNLYGYVQKKHWNVGLFRYFQIKQIPNFLLAMPVLVVSICAVTSWIEQSWTQFQRNEAIVANRTCTDQTPFTASRSVMRWAITALQKFTDDENLGAFESRCIENGALLESPILLGHYAVLAASSLVGLIMAHVQISTRLICSSCPAFYWYLAVKISKRNGYWGDAIVCWFLLYNILGIIMHPNWLPWT